MTTYEHRLVNVIGTPPSGETYDGIGRAADAEVAALRAELEDVKTERDSFKTRAQVAESQINRAVCAAHDSMPDYPWDTVASGEELSSACWAWQQTVKGLNLACDDLHARIAELEAGAAGLREALEKIDEQLEAEGYGVGDLRYKGCEERAMIASALANPTGQAFLEKHRAMERVCEAIEEGKNMVLSPRAANAIAAYRALCAKEQAHDQ